MWVLYLIPFILGVAFLGVALILNKVVKNMGKKYDDMKARCTESTKATVTGYKTERLMHSDDTWYTYLFLSYCDSIIPYTVSINPRKFPIGTELDIIYNPDDIQECIVVGVEMNGTIKTLKLMSGMFLVASLICVTLGIIFL